MSEFYHERLRQVVVALVPALVTKTIAVDGELVTCPEFYRAQARLLITLPSISVHIRDFFGLVFWRASYVLARSYYRWLSISQLGYWLSHFLSIGTICRWTRKYLQLCITFTSLLLLQYGFIIMVERQVLVLLGVFRLLLIKARLLSGGSRDGFDVITFCSKQMFLIAQINKRQ